MSMLEIAKSIALDVAKEARESAKRCMQKASETLDDVVDSVSEKVEYYAQKENMRSNVERLKDEYNQEAIKLAELVISSKVSTKSSYYQEVKKLRALKDEYEAVEKEFDDEYGEDYGFGDDDGDDTQEEEKSAQICTECGQSNDSDAKYCKACGWILT